MMRDTPKEGDLHTEAGLFLVMHEALAAEREWRARLERENAELSDQVMRWFKAASPYATPGSLEEGLKKLRAEAIKEVINAIEDAPLTYAGPDPHIVSDLRYLIIRSVRDLIEDHDGPIDSTVKPSAWD